MDASEALEAMIQGIKARGDSELYQMAMEVKRCLTYKVEGQMMNRRKRLESQLSTARECVRLFRLWCSEGKPIQGEFLQREMEKLDQKIQALDAEKDQY